jgi:hypothetical protein
MKEDWTDYTLSHSCAIPYVLSLQDMSDHKFKKKIASAGGVPQQVGGCRSLSGAMDWRDYEKSPVALGSCNYPHQLLTHYGTG